MIENIMRAGTTNTIFPVLVASGLMLVAAGCGATAKAPNTSSGDAAGDVVNSALSNGYSLLHELLSKQKNVDKLLWVKSVPPEVEKVIKAVARVSGEGEAAIARFAENNNTIELERQNLPAAERATRDAIEASTTRRLLTSSGRALSTLITLKQIEATEYGLHLAKALAENEEDGLRREWLSGFEASYREFRDELTAWLAGEGADVAKEQ